MMTLKILEQFEFLTVTKNCTNLSMWYTVPDLMEWYYVVEPSHFAGKFIVIFFDPFFFCVLVINELVNGPLQTLIFLIWITTYLEQI